MLIRISILLWLTTSASALAMSTSIVAVDSDPGGPTLVYLSDGSVMEAPADSEETIRALLPRPASREYEGIGDTLPFNYEGDILDEGLMTRWFKSMNRRTRYRAQCYNRAHVWAFEANRDLGIRSEKIFMFFSSRYIREYRYRWWFHVAPLIWVDTPDGPQERVMDPTFFDRPVPLKTWSDDFIKPQTPCKRVTRYSEYATLPHTEYCYFLSASMFSWQPKDLEAMDQGVPEKDRFVQFDIDTAYRQAFR
jgi:hypothetical protein